MKTLELDLGERSYPIYIGSGLLALPELLTRYIEGTRVAIVSNETVAPLYLEQVAKSLAACDPISIILPDGEQYKSWEWLSRIFDRLLEERCDRQVTLIALGGGVIGDMTGFAVLAQVDSSVGGKTGINHPLGKNMIGAFYQPKCVLIDTDTLKTLPDEELSAGLAEVIKYGLIRDVDFLDWLENNMAKLLARDPEALTTAIYRSCQHKAEVVAADEREASQRALLNLGHTFGHAIETGMGYGNWLHGEGVAAGMAMAADLSYRMGWIDRDAVDRVQQVLSAARLPVRGPEEITVERYIELMAVDKKVKAGKLRLVLLRALGDAFVSDNFDEKKLRETLAACRGADVKTPDRSLA
ncbi:MAG: 3-dehydroquinate synthase [Acidithiobacillales bacterium SG8_45]|nr:MAG: 3-dehydroquinate synthase [Acidithiobacillales bacterium SG8_45]